MTLKFSFLFLLTVLLQLEAIKGDSKQDHKKLELMLQSVARDPDQALSKLANKMQVRYKRSYNKPDMQYFERITKHNLTEEFLFRNIIGELIDNNLRNSQVYLSSLAKSALKMDFQKALNVGQDNSQRLKNCQRVLLKNEYYDLCKKEEGVSEPGCSSGLCDLNAVCFRENGMIKCRCRQGFIGDGSRGNCYNGTFCSGKFCRFNGQCIYSNSVNGYKCKCMLDCQNGGKCIQRPSKYECLCSQNYTGPLCTQSQSQSVANYKSMQGLKNQDNSNWMLVRNLAHLVGPSVNRSQYFLLNELRTYLKTTTRSSVKEDSSSNRPTGEENYFVF